MEKKNNSKRFTKKKIILLIILAIFIIFVIITTSKMIIISNLTSKMSKHLKQNNYHIMITTYQGHALNIAHSYHKDDKEYNSMLRFDSNLEKPVKIDSYKVGNTANVYIDNGEEKFMTLDSDSLIINFATNGFLCENNFGEILKQAIFTSIKTEKCNGKDCYYFSSLVLGDRVYIDKETGLPVRNVAGTSTNEFGETTNIVEDYKYEFGTVTDEDMKEPNRSEYKIND